MVHRRPVYIYFLNVPSFSRRYFNKIKGTIRLGRLLAFSLEILSDMDCFYQTLVQVQIWVHARWPAKWLPPISFFQISYMVCFDKILIQVLIWVLSDKT